MSYLKTVGNEILLFMYYLLLGVLQKKPPLTFREDSREIFHAVLSNFMDKNKHGLDPTIKLNKGTV